MKEREFVYYILMTKWTAGYHYNLGAYPTRAAAEAAYTRMQNEGVRNGDPLREEEFAGILKSTAGNEDLFNQSRDFAARAKPATDYVAPDVFSYSIEMKNWGANYGYDLGTYPTRAAAEAAYEQMRASGVTPRGATLRENDYRGILKHGEKGSNNGN